MLISVHVFRFAYAKAMIACLIRQMMDSNGVVGVFRLISTVYMRFFLFYLIFFFSLSTAERETHREKYVKKSIHRVCDTSGGEHK